jgi:DNA-binding CsgD family transcriptional regulator
MDRVCSLVPSRCVEVVAEGRLKAPEADPELPKAASWLRSFRYAPQAHTFSEVQWLVAQLVACGLADKEIAYVLGVSASTVKAHTGKIIHSMGLWRRSQLVRYILEERQFYPEEAELLIAQRLERFRANSEICLPSGPSENSKLSEQQTVNMA